MAPIQLYSFPTPNGQKLGIALEELGIPYEPHVINIMKGDNKTPEFTAVNPNQKIPAIVDPDGPDGKPISIFESGAILLYLAEKTGKLLPKDPREKWEVVEWVFWQMAGLGPTFGQFGHFYKFAPQKIEYAIDRYTVESKRLLGVLDKQLEGHDYVVGNEYTIADIAIVTWVDVLTGFYQAGDHLSVSEFKNVVEWSKRVNARPAVQKGKTVCRP
ncbi:glutathione S-transferase domain-containing protein [Gonapodya prolifera JEL478]|uniref:Glutathione S-transferase domain-containing protein n=1 Tax=Gonapodya prolifera (strain JEL478) TaxID=1344416 RepID=A0A139AHJ7_GONPJ|nr:glutathione S-transferase domain-containing protein [Gonapodya prolifera JEL478]|eukprot:KXS16277.1 glutathione S-transferase domain-containing protein [Gonapodya prolifera JEL478]